MTTIQIVNITISTVALALSIMTWIYTNLKRQYIKRRVFQMNRLDVLRQVNITQASRFIIGLAKMFPDDPEALEEHLKGQFTKEELQRINDAARKEGLSPLVFIP